MLYWLVTGIVNRVNHGLISFALHFARWASNLFFLALRLGLADLPTNDLTISGSMVFLLVSSYTLRILLAVAMLTSMILLG